MIFGGAESSSHRPAFSCYNCQHAVWFPDGTHILFNIWTNNNWQVAMIRADGSDFAYAKKSTSAADTWWSICWAADGHSFYAQNLERRSDFRWTGRTLRLGAKQFLSAWIIQQ